MELKKLLNSYPMDLDCMICMEMLASGADHENPSDVECIYPNNGIWCSSGPSRVGRGGGWTTSSNFIDAETRSSTYPDYSQNHRGFQFVKS